MLEDLSARAHGGAHFELQEDALRLLCSHAWPGNVRELRNTLERAVMLSDSERIDAAALAPFIGPAQAGGRAALFAQSLQSAVAPEVRSAQPSWAQAMAAF